MTEGVAWITIGAYTQLLAIDGTSVAVAFADWAPHESASDGVVDAYEFSWAPLEDLAQREVMFGLGWGPDEKERWTAAWGRARATAAWLQDEWIANQRRDSP